MKLYIVKPEYLDNWLAHGESAEQVIVNKEELERLAREWDKPVDELMEQLKEI